MSSFRRISNQSDAVAMIIDVEGTQTHLPPGASMVAEVQDGWIAPAGCTWSILKQQVPAVPAKKLDIQKEMEKLNPDEPGQEEVFMLTVKNINGKDVVLGDSRGETVILRPDETRKFTGRASSVTSIRGLMVVAKDKVTIQELVRSDDTKRLLSDILKEPNLDAYLEKQSRFDLKALAGILNVPAKKKADILAGIKAELGKLKPADVAVEDAKASVEETAKKLGFAEGTKDKPNNLLDIQIG